MKNRDERPLDIDKITESGWVLYERLLMLRVVNEQRAILGKRQVMINRVRAAERTSEGHIDYAHKFAVACRDIVLEP